jgi:hypothetical protein
MKALPHSPQNAAPPGTELPQYVQNTAVPPGKNNGRILSANYRYKENQPGGFGTELATLRCTSS